MPNCTKCGAKLTEIKLYTPEIERIFTPGHKEYDKNKILTAMFICLSHTCMDGKYNNNQYRLVQRNAPVSDW